MKARLLKRVDLLEVKNAFKFQHVDRLLKYAMEVRRIPSERAKIRSDYDLKEPDLETCREFGQQNVKEIKKMRTTKAEGKDIFKIVRAIV